MQILLDTRNIDHYRTFLKIKQLPSYRIRGHLAEFPDEYASQLRLDAAAPKAAKYTPVLAAYDYQRDITRMALDRGKFAIFADCVLGKTLMLLEFARTASESLAFGRKVLIVSPYNVVPQTVAECDRFYNGTLRLDRLTAAALPGWLKRRGRDDAAIGITNYEAITDGLDPQHLGGLILDESSILKSHYGKFGRRLIEMGKGLPYKLCCTGTPAPNDRIEYGNHAVFLDQFPTINAFLARYFVNRGQTSERWSLKPHALDAFYRSLSHWSIFLANPATYGWSDLDTSTIPPIHVHEHHVELTQEQRRIIHDTTDTLFCNEPGGITDRARWSCISKGFYKGKPVDSNKPGAIRDLVESWPDESTIIWCQYNAEQAILEKTFPEAASITGSTKPEDRLRIIDAFKAGETRVLISKPKILGFGLNLQKATRQVFSALMDSYESYYQAVKRSNRIGSTKPLRVHIPITELEEPMVANVLRKAAMVEQDTAEQERIFRNALSTWRTVATS